MNLFSMARIPEDAEIVEELVVDIDENVKIERIVSNGQTTDWLTQPQNEFVALLSGQAQIAYADGSQVKLTAGDTLVIPAGVTHRVSYTSSEPLCIWLTVFYGR